MRPCPRTHLQLRPSLIPATLHSLPILQSELDSLLLQSPQSRPDTKQVNRLLQLGECQLYTPGELKADPDFAPTHAGAKILIQKLHDYRLETKSLTWMGSISFESKNFHLTKAFRRAAANLFCTRQ
jgi:hypothetical protein